MSNGNPFYVEPLGGYAPEIGRGLSGLGSALQERRAMKQQQAAMERATELLESGTPEEIAKFSIANPELGKRVLEQVGIIKEGQEGEFIKDSQNILINPQNTRQILAERVERIRARGGDPSHTEQELAQYDADPEGYIGSVEKALAFAGGKGWEQYRELTADQTGAGMDVAGIKEFEYLTEGLSDEEKAKARRVKLGLSPRASEDAVSKAEKAFAVAAAKLEARLGLEPEVAGAVEAAKNQAKAEAAEVGEARSNEKAWSVYDGAMGNLARAMRRAETGPFVGFIPAVTANAQIAEGAVAVMAPVLKQMFRAAGEGVFTDKDQEMLMGMVPTRKDLPEAREAKIKAIDSIVRAKLGMGGEDSSEIPTVTSQAEFDSLQSGSTYYEDGTLYRKP